MKPPHCPSARPEWNGSFVFGVAAGTVEQPRVAYLNASFDITEDVRQLTEGVELTEVFRFAAPCVNSVCQQFRGGACTLARRTVELLPAVVASLPDCLIRPTCRWFEQEGHAACFRCPQVVTDQLTADPLRIAITTPPP